jgi:hypothetical protein
MVVSLQLDAGAWEPFLREVHSSWGSIAYGLAWVGELLMKLAHIFPCWKMLGALMAGRLILEVLYWGLHYAMILQILLRKIISRVPGAFFSLLDKYPRKLFLLTDPLFESAYVYYKLSFRFLIKIKTSINFLFLITRKWGKCLFWLSVCGRHRPSKALWVMLLSSLSLGSPNCWT